MSNGILYVVSTPIGNLEDITFRAVRILKEVDLIAAEDTRHSLKLLSHFGISKPLISYWGERERQRAEEIVEKLRAGRSVALISDAGTPGIADPGIVLIRRAIEEGISVIPVPGPTAAIAALSISGFSTEGFVFLGFLPSKKAVRRKALDEISLEEKTVVIYEAPHRILDTLSEMAVVFGRRRAVLVREITKMFEEVIRGDISEVSDRLQGSRIAGEYVVIIEGKSPEGGKNVEDAVREIRALMKKGLGRKEAVRRISEEYGLSKKELYELSLEGR